MKLIPLFLLLPFTLSGAQIDRKAVVVRHNITTTDPRPVLALGNGEFCFGVDGTGLQTIAGNIMANWAWHSFPLPEGTTMADVPETGTIETGRLTGEMKHASAKEEVSEWMFRNPHRFNLGRFSISDASGRVLTSADIQEPERTLDLWRGIQTAVYKIRGHAVRVETTVHPELDEVAVRIESDLVGTGDLGVALEFPYPANAAGNNPQVPWYGNWDAAGIHHSEVIRTPGKADIIRQIDQTRFYVTWKWADSKATMTEEPAKHLFRLLGAPGCHTLEFVCAFGLNKPHDLPGVESTIAASSESWRKYWMSGGAIDLSESRDPRWKELERRIVLSQYLMATQSAGSWPPAEFSLTGEDGWSSQFHMEMVWWHLAHYGLWDRWDKATRALGCYNTFLPVAQKMAAQFGYQGAKWGKMVGPEGRTAPWSPTNLLHWQQPHPIFFAEMEYRLKPTRETIEKWKNIVFQTAEYMADFPVKRPDGKYHLTPVITANENGIGDDPAFESAYWRWGLAMAQEWKDRAGQARVPKWDLVLKCLAPLPQADGVYLFCNGWTNTYTKFNSGHPDPLGVCAFLPFVDGVDRETARRTVEKIGTDWKWADMWGWDYPWAAMAAARVGRPDLAMEMLLKDVGQNGYTLNGINEGWYFPGNGGLLYAVAMMAAGWDGAPAGNAPGFPGNGQWMVKWEGLKKAL